MSDELSDEDKALWDAQFAEEKSADEENFEELLDQKPETKEKKPLFAPPKAKKPLKPHNEPLDRAIERKLKQGKIDPEATLDLHGLNQQDAFQALNQFVQNSYNKGIKHVLVVTGKGKGVAEADDWLVPGQGILKGKLPEWIKSQPLKNYIIDAVFASPKHGGTGAYYVIIKKKK